MGDGNITWKSEDNIRTEAEDNKKGQTTERKCEDLNGTPRSCKDEDNLTPNECSPPNILLPLELEELHRNTNNNVNTPDISSASIESPAVCTEATPNSTPRRRNLRAGTANEFGLPFGPAAGLGPQDTAIPETNAEIFSVRGTRSFKINRHRDSVTVFPSGCMGIKDEVGKELETTPIITETVPTITETASTITGTEQSTSPSNLFQKPNSAARNPLTGEGYENKSAKQQNNMKRRDGNPVLGHGYEDGKNVRMSSKVPPGGYSKGLW